MKLLEKKKYSKCDILINIVVGGFGGFGGFGGLGGRGKCPSNEIFSRCDGRCHRFCPNVVPKPLCIKVE